jgi:hypothetical protein
MRLDDPGLVIPPFPLNPTPLNLMMRPSPQRSEHDTVPVPYQRKGKKLYSTREGVKTGEESIANV